MDLLAKIIERKKIKPSGDVLTVVKNLLQDIIVYEKLATNVKFQSVEHPIVAKRCKTLAKLNDTMTLEYVILKDLLPFLVSVTGRSIGTLALMEQTRQEEILNQTFGFSLNIYDFDELRELPKEYLAIKENIDEKIYKLVVFVSENNAVRAYTKTVNEDQLIEETIEHFSITEQGDNITITSFSSLGNNDYPFGTINNKPIRIRNNVLYVGAQKVLVDTNKLAILGNSVSDVAEYLLGQYKKLNVTRNKPS